MTKWFFFPYIISVSNFVLSNHFNHNSLDQIHTAAEMSKVMQN